MNKVEIPALYNQYHVLRGYELESLFADLTKHFCSTSVLYPGCYVHITPSFFIPRAVYVDLELTAKKFFEDPGVRAYIEHNKTYVEEPDITFYHQSYLHPIDEPEESFDLVVSQYAGFVSEPTKKYLKKGGLLVANNSHGDAGLASIDPDFKLVATVGQSGITDKNLDDYFIPKKETLVTPDYQKQLGKGIGYKKTARNYIFEKQ